MDVDELSLIGPFDLASVDALHRKRLLAFINHFLTQTIHFLNRFSSSCEGKLFQTELRLQKLEAALILLESKLGSIPSLTDPKTIAESSNEANPHLPAVEEQNLSSNLPQDNIVQDDEDLEEAPLDESLLKFTKMLHVGVPLPAVKLKMEQEGVTPEMQQLVLNHSK